MSSKISQKQSVVDGVKKILESSFDSSISAREQLSDEQLTELRQYVVNGIASGTVEYGKEYSNEKELSKYVAGMVANHLRKAKELNGGTTYSPQSTGRGVRDEQLVELNKLLKTYKEGTSEYNQVSDAINSRKAEISADKAANVKEKRKVKELASINMEALPENLRLLANDLVSNN